MVPSPVVRRAGPACVAAGLLAAACAPDLGVGGGADACRDALVCDDFEAYAPAAAPGGRWAVGEEGGVVVVDETRARSGSRSVKLSTDAGAAFKAAVLELSDPSLLPVDGNVLHGRMMFWLESVPIEDVQWSFVVGRGFVIEGGYTALYRYGGQVPIPDGGAVGSQLTASYETPDSYADPPVGPATNCWQHADGETAPVGAWTCAQWKLDGQNDEMQLWLGGAEIPSLHVRGHGEGCQSQTDPNFPWTAPEFTAVFLGWETYGPDAARAIWLDDVAIGTAPIPCP